MKINPSSFEKIYVDLDNRRYRKTDWLEIENELGKHIRVRRNAIIAIEELDDGTGIYTDNNFFKTNFSYREILESL